MLRPIYERVVEALSARALTRAAAGSAPVRVLGLGKVAGEMAMGVPNRVDALLAALHGASGPGEVLHGGHPLPDAGSLLAGEALLRRAASFSADDEVLVLISGGGSAIAEAPLTGIDLQTLRAVNDALVRSGAPIEEMNCVRAHLSRLKGGGLAAALRTRRARALVCVDVPRGGFAAVASGPCAADATTLDDARRIARRVGLPELPMRETLKESWMPHEVLCDLRSPALVAARSGFAPLPDLPLTGSVDEFSARVAGFSGSVCASGELTVRVPPDAPPGGRDQQLALLVARAIRGRDARFLAAGTDGQDGNGNAAGAEVDGTTWDEAVRRGLAPDDALARFDAARVLEALGCLIPARQTGAHAGDLFLYRAW